MTRLRADMILLLTALIWGAAFIAQKTGMEGLGPCGFTGARFLLSALVVLPFALRERARVIAPMERRHLRWAALLCPVFFLAVVMQQAGMMTTTVTNAGFLTGLYVIFVPFCAWFLFRQRPSAVIWPAALLSLLGVYLLSGASLSAFTPGDWMVLSSAVFYGVQVALAGFLVQSCRRPLTLCLMQYVTCAALGLGLAFVFESGVSVAGLQANMIQILYAGLISGGIAYTLQLVAQQYTPPSDAAIILLGEAPFAALAGAVILGDRLDAAGLTGCALILAAALLVEAGVLLRKKKNYPKQA
ncbi:MAG TPA: DMT family transporter [Alphaproteobacteria bacterium]|jgi:drug/metabolite transporter (DMT)-like permease